jgi:Zn-dependent metalloprotease
MKITLLIAAVLWVTASYAQVDKSNNTARQQDSPPENQADFRPRDPIKIVEDFGVGRLESIKLDDNGIPRAIRGDLEKGITATDPLEKCYQFFEIHKDIFGLNDPREELVLYVNNPHTKKFYQAHNGVKVQFAGYFMHFNMKGKLNELDGEIDLEAKKVATTPAISREAAQKIAFDEFKTNPEIPANKLVPDTVAPRAVETELMLSRIDGQFRLVWDIAVGYDMPWGGVMRYVIDAQTGAIIQRTNPMMRKRY